MFRLLSLLIVIAIMGLLWVTMADSMFGGGEDCVPSAGPTTTLPIKVSKGLERLVTDC